MILTEVIISLFHLKIVPIVLAWLLVFHMNLLYESLTEEQSLSFDYLLSDNRSPYHISRIFWEHIDEDDLKLHDIMKTLS